MMKCQGCGNQNRGLLYSGSVLYILLLVLVTFAGLKNIVHFTRNFIMKFIFFRVPLYLLGLIYPVSGA